MLITLICPYGDDLSGSWCVTGVSAGSVACPASVSGAWAVVGRAAAMHGRSRLKAELANGPTNKPRWGRSSQENGEPNNAVCDSYET